MPPAARLTALHVCPLLTVRGALLGDLLRLCAAAPRALAGARPPTFGGLLSLPG